ncbi:MAG: hypothetical protein HY323_19450 [Betaproteobacteria bacterium]|nr:hypothetical protein [Betaproteobacteria bacterium]
MLRAAALIEKLGIPTVSIIATGFLKQAELVAKGLGVPLALAEYPGHPMVDSEEELKRKVEEVLAPGVLRALTLDAPPPAATAEEEPAPGEVIFSGTFDEVQERFYRRLWTDGLPIVPPTRDRVAAFLEFTDRKPEEVIRVVPQEGREATILSIAVNGVMAGCRPEYMPVLVAVVEAMCDPVFRIEDAGSTPGWEPLVIVNGPIIKQLDFNCGQGVLRVGRQANTSVGRFVRMYLRNICGYRIPPGAGDKGSIGQTFLVALAEDEDTAGDIGWPTFAEDRGYARGENVVTVHSVVCITSPVYSAGARAADHVRQWGEVMGAAFAYWTHTGFKRGLWNPLIVAGPNIATVIAREWSKAEVRRYLHERVTITAERATHYARMTATPTFDLEQLVKDGILPPEYAASRDPDRPLRMFIKPGMIGILVAGDPDRNQSRGYMGNHVQGPPTSRRVELPRAWDKLLKRAG